MRKRNLIIIIALALALVVIGIAAVMNFNGGNAEKIKNGDNKYKMCADNLEDDGFNEFKKIINMTSDIDDNCSVSYFEAQVDEDAEIQTFTLSLDTFDKNGSYKGTASYTYSLKDKTLNYSKPQILTTELVYKLNPNSKLEYLGKQLKKIPLKKQIKLSKLDRYVIAFQPYTKVESGTPIFDARTIDEIKPLNKKDYNSGKGGISDGNTSVVIRLYDGTSIASGQQYLYVFTPLDSEAAVGNQLTSKECDYYIDNGTLKFTTDYGASYFDGDISEKDLNETLDFYGNSLSLQAESVFVSNDVTAYFYGKNPMLKIYHSDSGKWLNYTFPTEEDYGRPITKRTVGFVNSLCGFAALGTDWSMGGGENKKCYFTSDGGISWTEKDLPENVSSNTLIDICMADENVGAVALEDGINGEYPKVFVTDNKGDSWTEFELPFDNLPGDVQYLTDIESFEIKDGKYVLTLGQEDSGTLKAVFASNSLASGWQFSKTYNSTIHTVG